MTHALPRTSNRELQFEHGTAIGLSHRWEAGQYCSILTKAGIVGCGIYDLATPAEFGQAIAIAKGTPENPLVEPEDLFDAKIVGATPKAESMLHERGVLMVPDVIANAGGVICASVEYHGGSESQAFAAIEEKIRRNTARVLEDAKAENQLPRAAAMALAERRVRRAMALRRWS